MRAVTGGLSLALATQGATCPHPLGDWSRTRAPLAVPDWPSNVPGHTLVLFLVEDAASLRYSLG
jgi:hypothetical protein